MRSCVGADPILAFGGFFSSSRNNLLISLRLWFFSVTDQSAYPSLLPFFNRLVMNPESDRNYAWNLRNLIYGGKMTIGVRRGPGVTVIEDSLA